MSQITNIRGVGLDGLDSLHFDRQGPYPAICVFGAGFATRGGFAPQPRHSGTNRLRRVVGGDPIE